MESSIFEHFRQKRVLILGDVMIDRYLTGNVSRISPEAPVPVVLQRGMEDRLGGAANVALNIQALGAIPILCSVIGDDADGHRLRNEIFVENNISTEGLVTSNARRSTVKTRVLGNNQQMLRIDAEDTQDLNAQEHEKILTCMKGILDRHSIDAIILQDYNKGVLTLEVIRETIKAAKKRNIFTAVDPKKHNFWAYVGVDLFKPNMKEIRDCVPFQVDPDEASLQHVADYVREKLQNKLNMITLSERGLFLEDVRGGKLYPTKARNVADVSGAGDTVISIATLALAAGAKHDKVALLSNLAGGQVCEFPGVVSVQLALLADELAEMQPKTEY
jgi:D-glycero-beta-D-manno-heptose-7-phosphate kinase